MSDSRLVPNIRFKKFEIQWSKYKFADMLDKNNGIRRGPFGSSLRKDSFVKKGDYVVYEQQNAIYNMYKTRYNINKSKFEELKKFELQPGDFIMSGAGTIGKISEVPEGITPGIFNQALIRFKINKKTTSRTFFLTFMRSYTMQRKLTEKNPGSAISNLVSMKEVKNFSIVIPDKQEQQKIGNFFAKLDKLLDLQQQKIDKLELLKKALLQKLFPKHDTKIPELRFKGYKEDWRDKKTLELVSERNSKIIPNDEYPLKAFIAKKGISEKGEKYNRSFLVKSRQKKYKKTEYGDLIYSSNNLEVGSIGINRYGNACISPVYSIFKVNNSLTYDFLGYLIQRKEFIFNMIRYRQGVTYGQWKIHESDFLNIQVLVPETIDEQQKIGNLLSKVDQLIELENKKLQDFQQVKKCLLQNMFVE